ncbi:hypothetical protein AVEN_57818-1 [Araneus ventricosus]|uniref:Uncharacterized protein n=1 Tax=Araneus ventricosus TaxID=182803 RepID=A0A4Y2I8L6_ARAVE|nr:hypothetical protein AVEN_57818-1 [Araneus ventricosus]
MESSKRKSNIQADNVKLFNNPFTSSFQCRFESDVTLASIMTQEMTYVIKKFYPYFWRKFKFPVEDDTETECVESVKDLREAVWVHRIVSLWPWRTFLKTILSQMIYSRETYVSYIFFMISTTVKDLLNRHESFMTSCSLVTAIAAYVYNEGYHDFLGYCPDILMVLFEENYLKESDRIQIWDHLRDHLLACHYSEAYKIVEQKTNGNPFADVVNELDFVTEIKKIIKSNISVGEHAAVYRHTTEVIKRFKTRTPRNHSFIENKATISKRNASSQIEESLRNTERLTIEGDYLKDAKISSSLRNTEEQRKSESGQIILTEHIELVNLTIAQSHSAGQSLQNEMQEISLQTELSLSDARKLKISKNEQSSVSLKDAEGGGSKDAEISSSESQLRTPKSKKKKSKKEKVEKPNTYGEDSEAHDLKISSYSEEQSLQNIAKPRDTEASLPVPSKKEVLYALLFLIQKLNNSFRGVCDLLCVPMNN